MLVTSPPTYASSVDWMKRPSANQYELYQTAVAPISVALANRVARWPTYFTQSARSACCAGMTPCMVLILGKSFNPDFPRTTPAEQGSPVMGCKTLLGTAREAQM